jgi:hypothetical protein
MMGVLLIVIVGIVGLCLMYALGPGPKDGE